MERPLPDLFMRDAARGNGLLPGSVTAGRQGGPRERQEREYISACGSVI